MSTASGYSDRSAKASGAFVYEIVSEDDAKRYGLDQLFAEFHPFGWRNGRPIGKVYAWAIDRERDIYLMAVDSIMEVGPSGLPQYRVGTVYVLNWQGRRALMAISPQSGSSEIREAPFGEIGDLTHLDISQLSAVPQDELVAVIKDALTTYGAR